MPLCLATPACDEPLVVVPAHVFDPDAVFNVINRGKNYIWQSAKCLFLCELLRFLCRVPPFIHPNQLDFARSVAIPWGNWEGNPGLELLLL